MFEKKSASLTFQIALRNSEAEGTPKNNPETNFPRFRGHLGFSTSDLMSTIEIVRQAQF